MAHYRRRKLPSPVLRLYVAYHTSLTSLQGLNQLPYSFYPHVGSITAMDRSIERAEFLPETDQVQLSWKDSYTDTTYRDAKYDYALVSPPFSKVRSWRFPNTRKLPRLMRISHR